MHQASGSAVPSASHAEAVHRYGTFTYINKAEAVHQCSTFIMIYNSCSFCPTEAVHRCGTVPYFKSEALLWYILYSASFLQELHRYGSYISMWRQCFGTQEQMRTPLWDLNQPHCTLSLTRESNASILYYINTVQFYIKHSRVLYHYSSYLLYELYQNSGPFD